MLLNYLPFPQRIALFVITTILIAIMCHLIRMDKYNSKSRARSSDGSKNNINSNIIINHNGHKEKDLLNNHTVCHRSDFQYYYVNTKNNLRAIKSGIETHSHNTISIVSKNNDKNNNGNKNNTNRSRSNNNKINTRRPTKPHPGHLRPFGESGSKSRVKETSGFPENFVHNFLVPSIPVLMKGAATPSPAFHKWTDNYLIELNLRDGDHFLFGVETTKKERRDQEVLQMELPEFLNVYNDSELYLVSEVPSFLQRDLLTPDPLLDPSLKTLPVSKMMWMSSGGTKSVVHIDREENINCLYRGRKNVILMDPGSFNTGSVIDEVIGVYSRLDVDKVDLNFYPTLEGANFITATMEAGDCMYIPYRWVHQVRSFGSNIAVNSWVDHYKLDDLIKSQQRECDQDCAADISDGHLVTSTSLDQQTGIVDDDVEWKHFIFILIFQQTVHRLSVSNMLSRCYWRIEQKKARTYDFINNVRSNLAPTFYGEMADRFTGRVQKIFTEKLRKMDKDEDGFISLREFDRTNVGVWGDIVKSIRNL